MTIALTIEVFWYIVSIDTRRSGLKFFIWDLFQKPSDLPSELALRKVNFTCLCNSIQSTLTMGVQGLEVSSFDAECAGK